MLKPSQKHYLCYDAQEYEQKGFAELAGRVAEMAQAPRYWQITASAITQDAATGERQKKHFNFRTKDRFKLGELAPMINDRIHADDDYLPDTVSVKVCARIMTEGGV